MIHRLAGAAALATLAACSSLTVPPAPEMLPLLEGYRDPIDPCRRLAETAFTIQFLEDGADLVGCHEDARDLDRFVTATNAVAVARTSAYILYSVPHRRGVLRRQRQSPAPVATTRPGRQSY